MHNRAASTRPAVAQTLNSPNGATDTASSSRLVQGLLAFDADNYSEATQLLAEPVGALDDWRLLVLAESAHRIDDPGLANEALTSLIGKHRGSPIRSHALLRAAQISADQELWEMTLRWIETAREENLPRDESRDIETLAWEIGQTLSRPDVQSRAARRLLVDHPLEAEELAVEAFLAELADELDWDGALTAAELGQRARRQMEDREPKAALETLDRIPDDQRSFDWTLLRAEVLTRARRGMDALEVLDGLASSDTERQVAIAWQRALAAREAGRVRRGRRNLPQASREKMRAEARANLRQVAELTADPEQRYQATQVLFILVSDQDDSFEPSLEILASLQKQDSSDTTGTRYLWRLGWQAYAKRDYPVAIGYWSELESMYSGTTSARSGRYWTARAHEALGHGSRARDIYRQILSSEADDFYSRHARNRLDGETPAGTRTPSQPTEPWPDDPVLDRAVWLRELGLNELAMRELEGQEQAADRQAFCAEKAVLLARLGQRRDSIQSLVCAFPALGRANQDIVPREAQVLYYPLDFRSIIEQRAREHELPAELVFAMVRQESAFDAEARSWAGARGLMQLMPATGREVAQRLGLRYSTSRLNDPDFSVRLGTKYFRQVLDMFDGNQELALAGYNGGPYRIKKLWRQAGRNRELDRFVEGLSLEETKTYVKRIVLFEDSYIRLYSEDG